MIRPCRLTASTGCNQHNVTFNTSTCFTLTGIDPNVRVIINYITVGGVPYNPNGNHGVKNFFKVQGTSVKACS